MSKYVKKIYVHVAPLHSIMNTSSYGPIYYNDRLVVPAIRNVTGLEGGISLLQRMALEIFLSILPMVAAGFIECVRRASAVSYTLKDGMAPITVFWLAPQLMLMGFLETFNIIGHIEFYIKEFPENMTSVVNLLFSCTMVGANYLSTVLVNVVHGTTCGDGHLAWLTKDINVERVENLYFLIAGLGVANLGYFLWVARGYQYKSKYRVDDDFDVELNVLEK